MKLNNLIPILIIIGLVVLFFFPEPETNFGAYFGTALFFVLLIFWQKKRDNKIYKN